MPIIFRYLLKGVSVPFFVCLAVFTSVLFLARVLKFFEMVVNKNVPPGKVMVLFAYVVPGFLEIAIPMALLISVILLFSRLSLDSELVAMRTSGLTLLQLSLPIFAFAGFVWGCGLFISIWLRPWSDLMLGQGLFELAKLRASSGLVQGTFNPYGKLTIYAERIDPQNSRLYNLLIADAGSSGVEERIFFSKQGRIISDDQARQITLQLYDGSVQQGRGKDFNVTYFDINNFALDNDELLPSESGDVHRKKTRQLSTSELWTQISSLESQLPQLGSADLDRLHQSEVELHRRFAVPTSVLCVVLLALALGVQPSRSEKTLGAGMSVSLGAGIVVIYYLLTSFLNTLAEEGLAPAFVLCWLPNVLFLCGSFYVFRQIESERWIAISDGFASLGKGLKNRLEGFLGGL